MLRTLGIVEARLASSADFGSARKLGSQSLLEWIVRRATESQRLTGVIVLAAAGPQAKLISALVPPDIPLIVRPDADPLSRFVAALESFNTDAVVRIRDDSPFIDPVLVDRLITTADLHPECDYISYCSRGGGPGAISNVGIFAEWFRVDAIRQAGREAKLASEREHVTRYLCAHPERFNMRLIPAPAQLDRDDVRLAIDGDEDWEHARTVYDALGPEGLEWQRIAGYLDHQPQLRERMAELNRRL